MAVREGKRDWKSTATTVALFIVTVFTALNVNGQVQAMRDQVALLREDVSELGEVREEIRDLARARNQIIRAIRRAARNP